MVDAATDGDLNFTAETNELAVPNLNVGTAAEISRLNVTGVSTFSDDVTFDGATAGRDITFDRSNNALQFEDWAQARFGSGTDNLSIYHNGANSIISNDGSNSGSIYIKVTKDNERVHIQSDNGSGGLADYFRAQSSTGEAILYHYGNDKLTTKSDGIEVTGTTDTDQLNVSGVSTFKQRLRVLQPTMSSHSFMLITVIFQMLEHITVHLLTFTQLAKHTLLTLMRGMS